MKNYKDFIGENGAFDAKAFSDYNTRLFDAFREQINYLSALGMPGGADVKTAFDDLYGELKKQDGSEPRLESLSNKFSAFRNAADSWNAKNLEKDQDTMSYILSAQTKLDGEDCTFSDFMFENNFSAMSLSEELSRLHAAEISGEPDNEFTLFSSENEVKNEFSLFDSGAEEKKESEIEAEKQHPNMVYDSSFTGSSSKNTMQRMSNDAPIFPHGKPEPQDILQKEDGSCFMLGTLWSIASRRPQMIRDLISDNNDGTVTVHFFKDGDIKKPHDVTIEKSLPNTDTSAAPWVRLVEKAYMASKLKVNQSTRKTEPVSMDALGWYDPCLFMKNILPQDPEPVKPDTEILAQPNFDASKKKFVEMLREAEKADSVITITSEKHVMGYKGLSEKNGKIFVNYYDQYSSIHERSISVDDLFSPQSSLDMINVTRFAGNGAPIYHGFSPKATAKQAMELDQTLSKESFGSIFRTFYKDRLNQDIKDVMMDGQTFGNGIISQFGFTKSVDTLLNNEFAKLHSPKVTVRDYLKSLDSPAGKQYKEALMDKIEEAFIVDISVNAPDKAKNFRAVRTVLDRPIKGDPAAPQKKEDAQKELPKKEEEKQRTQAEIQEDSLFSNIEGNLEALEESRRNRKNNSPEFNAMTDAIRDLAYARKNGVPKERLELLEQRAYIKCKYYEDHKNPHTPEGQNRKLIATIVKSSISEINPSVEQSLNKKTSAELISTEIAAHLADDMIKKHPEAFRTSPDDPRVDENLRAKLVDQWARNSELKQFAGNLKAGTAEEFISTMCKSGMPELLTKAVTKNLLEPMTEAKVELSAKEKKAAETSFGIRSHGMSR